MNDVIESVITHHHDRVRAWLANEPGAWGFLAGQAVLGERLRLGRSLTEPERRLIWQALWNRLLHEKARTAGSD
jgi:hypothetical protein